MGEIPDRCHANCVGKAFGQNRAGTPDGRSVGAGEKSDLTASFLNASLAIFLRGCRSSPLSEDLEGPDYAAPNGTYRQGARILVARRHAVKVRPQARPRFDLSRPRCSKWSTGPFCTPSPTQSFEQFQACVRGNSSAAVRPGSRRSPLKTFHWTVLSAFGGRASPLHPLPYLS
jgi:hypothetical protein